MVDGRLMVVRDDYSGRIVEVRRNLLLALLDAGVVPVISPPALGEEGEVLNVDADRVAAAVAVGIGAAGLVLLTDKPGLLRDAADECTLLDRYELPGHGPIGQPASGGMRRKLVAARTALLSGVEQVVIADGRRERPAARALAGAGTTVTLHQPSEVGVG
jgi:[amino group carrier protein]-L-2-aminoadipate/L-glutamate 6-kinase